MNVVATCSRCPHSARNCRGPCACTVDGKDIREHAESGYCPKGYFTGTCQRCGGEHNVSVCDLPRPNPKTCTDDSGPGSAIKMIISALGIPATSGCGCERFCRKMNAWGWVGCVKHRREIIQWFGAKAKESSIDISPAGLRRIVLNAIFRRNSIPE